MMSPASSFVSFVLTVFAVTSGLAAVVQPLRSTATLADDPDDPAIWIDRLNPARSVILGTNKAAAPNGALLAFNLDGSVRQTIMPLNRPNNVDVEYGFRFGSRDVDIAVVTERLHHRLRIFVIARDTGLLTDAGSIPVLEGEAGQAAEPMGIGLYRRPGDGQIFAIVSPKTGGTSRYLWQYRLDGGADGTLRGTLVRRFGLFSRRGPSPGEIGEIEAVVVDDDLGFVYYADERFGIHKWHADPDHADAANELAVFGTDGYQLDREGLGIYRTGDGTGFIVSTDQIPGGSILRLYKREGEPGSPHEHRAVREVPISADETDGIEVTPYSLPGFDGGMLVAMNRRERNFLLYRWKDLLPDLP